jgi:hypothetical protein
MLLTKPQSIGRDGNHYFELMRGGAVPLYQSDARTVKFSFKTYSAKYKLQKYVNFFSTAACFI